MGGSSIHRFLVIFNLFDCTPKSVGLLRHYSLDLCWICQLDFAIFHVNVVNHRFDIPIKLSKNSFGLLTAQNFLTGDLIRSLVPDRSHRLVIFYQRILWQSFIFGLNPYNDVLLSRIIVDYDLVQCQIIRISPSLDFMNGHQDSFLSVQDRHQRGFPLVDVLVISLRAQVVQLIQRALGVEHRVL